MNKRGSALGRGLGALIDDQKYESKLPQAPRAGVSEVEIAQIAVNPFQPRTEFDTTALDELAESIRTLGIIQPITLRRQGDNQYQLISGERRLRASKMAGLTKIPAYVREADDQAMLEFALVENIQREDLNAIEIAISYKRLIEECKLTQEEMSGRVGKNRSTVTNYLRLLKLPAAIQVGLRDKTISMGHARALINIEDESVQTDLYARIVKDELSVRRTEELVRELAKPQQAKKPEAEKKPELPERFEFFANRLKQGMQAEIEVNRMSSGVGRIVIPFKSDADFDRLSSMLEQLMGHE